MGWAHGQFYTIFVDNRTWPKPGKLLGYDGIKLDVTSNSVSKKDIVDEFWKGEQRWAAGIYMSRSSTHQIRLLVGLVVNKQLLNCHQVSKRTIVWVKHQFMAVGALNGVISTLPSRKWGRGRWMGAGSSRFQLSFLNTEHTSKYYI